MIYKQPPSWLAHHGVEGQRWGVRHGPPYPIQDTILRRGTKLNSVSSVKNPKKYKNQKDHMMYTYRPDNENDATIYRGAFTKYLKLTQNGAKIFDHEYTTLRDLKMPTSKQRMDEFINLYNGSKGKEKQRFTDELNQTWLNTVMYGGTDSREAVKDYNLVTAKDGRLVSVDSVPVQLSGKSAQAAYNVFNHAMEASHAYEITRQYVKNIKSKYDAMVDDNNVNVYNGAQDPIIIFDPKNDLASVRKKSKEITEKEMESNIDKLKGRLPEGKKVML